MCFPCALAELLHKQAAEEGESDASASAERDSVTLGSAGSRLRQCRDLILQHPALR